MPEKTGCGFLFPPKAGAAQAFYFDAASILADMKAKGTTSTELSLSLVPAHKTGKPMISKIRIVGARLAGN